MESRLEYQRTSLFLLLVPGPTSQRPGPTSQRIRQSVYWTSPGNTMVFLVSADHGCPSLTLPSLAAASGGAAYLGRSFGPAATFESPLGQLASILKVFSQFQVEQKKSLFLLVAAASQSSTSSEGRYLFLLLSDSLTSRFRDRIGSQHRSSHRGLELALVFKRRGKYFYSCFIFHVHMYIMDSRLMEPVRA
jgi:hypothetical protein